MPFFDLFFLSDSLFYRKLPSNQSSNKNGTLVYRCLSSKAICAGEERLLGITLERRLMLFDVVLIFWETTFILLREGDCFGGHWLLLGGSDRAVRLHAFIVTVYSRTCVLVKSSCHLPLLLNQARNRFTGDRSLRPAPILLNSIKL